MQQHIALYSNGKRTGKQAKEENTAYHHSDKPRVRPKLDEYLNGTGITRKEFVELSVDYFQRTGFDLRGEAFDLSPLEKVTGRLEQSAKIMEQANEGTEAVRQLLQAVKEQTAIQNNSLHRIYCKSDQQSNRTGTPYREIPRKT